MPTCPARAADAERSSVSPGRKPVNDEEYDDRRLADGLHDVTLPSVAMAAAAAAAAAIAALFCSELRVPRWNALRRSVDATIPAIVCTDPTSPEALYTACLRMRPRNAQRHGKISLN